MKKGSVLIWIAAAAFVVALVLVLRQPDGTANGDGVPSGGGAAAQGEFDRVVVLTPPNACEGVAWGSIDPLFGEKGVVTRLLKTAGDIAKSPMGAGLLAGNPKAAEFLDPTTLRRKIREMAEKTLGFDPFKFARITFAFCRGADAVFLPRDAVAKAGGEIAESRAVGEFVVVSPDSKGKALLDAIGAWNEATKKVDHPAVAALREVRTLRKGFGGETFGALLFGGFKARPRLRTGFVAIESARAGFRVRAGVAGDDGALAEFEKEANEAIGMTRAMIDRLPPQAAAGLAVAGGADKLKKLVDGVKIGREGSFLTVAANLDFEDFSAIGMLSAVAIPTYLKYIKRAKTAEARVNTKRIASAARAYFAEERVDASGKIVEKAFPATTEWTPAGSACGRPGDKFTVDSKAWEGETWRALKFSIDDPHYFSYQFVSAGVGSSASFTVRARGDLSCDGKLTMLERVGRIDADGNVEGTDAVLEATDKGPRDDSAARGAAIVITDAKARKAAVGKLVTLEGVVENSKIATLLGVDVESDSPDLRGEKATATGILRRMVVTRQEIDDRTAKFGQFAHRGAGTFYSLVDPATGRLAQVKRP